MFDSWVASPSSSTSALTVNSADEPIGILDATPSPLDAVSPVVEPRTLLSISTAFSPCTIETQDSDLVLASSDGVYFFVHRARLLTESSNSFGGLLPPIQENKKVEDAMISVLTSSPLEEDTSIHDPTIDLHSISAIEDIVFSSAASDPADKPPEVIALPLQSSVLNVILHVVYGLPMVQFRPDLQLLCHALSELVTFGYRPSDLVTLHSEIFHLLVAHSRTYPLVVYALAAGHQIERLAVTCSSNTLGVELSEVTDELASRI